MNNTVLKYLENSCSKFKEKIAFIDEHNSITYEQTKHKALTLSNEIINKIGYTNNKAILIFLPKSVEAIVSMLGVTYSGNFYTPTNVKFPSSKIISVIDILLPSLIITNTLNKSKLLELGITEEKIICYDLINFKQDIFDLKNNAEKTIDTDLVYTYFTSGSTGVPKGVSINHINIIDYIDWACDKFLITNETIFGNQSALYFDITTQDIFATLKKSATMVIIPEKLFTFPIKAVEFIKERNINFLYWVPSAYINLANFKALDSIVLDKIKTIMFGGEVMPVKHLNYLKKHLPNLTFIANVYGPTETTVNSTYYIVNKEYKEDQSLPLGHNLENKKILLLDNTNKLITDVNKIGEICILGTSISPGYYRNKEKTEEVFVQNPLHENFRDIMYKTGDLAMYNNENLLIFCGRKDNQIKHLGYRIELGEIETAALSLKDVSNCISFYNEKKRKITLIYISENQDFNDREIKLALINLLPKFMVPSKFHKIMELPINNNGKIDRILIKKQYT